MANRIMKARSVKTAREYADKALKARLYVSGWCLSGELLYIRDGMPDAEFGLYSIAIAIEDDVPVGVSIVNDSNNLQVFVRKAKRGQGYGRKLVNRIKREGAYGICGADGDGKVFVNNGVEFR